MDDYFPDILRIYDVYMVNIVIFRIPLGHYYRMLVFQCIW